MNSKGSYKLITCIILFMRFYIIILIIVNIYLSYVENSPKITTSFSYKGRTYH